MGLPGDRASQARPAVGGAAAGDRLSAIADILDTAGEFLEALDNGAELEEQHTKKKRRSMCQSGEDAGATKKEMALLAPPRRGNGETRDHHSTSLRRKAPAGGTLHNGGSARDQTSLLPTQPEEPVGPLPAPPEPEAFGANAPAIGDPWCGHGGPETGDVETAETLPGHRRQPEVLRGKLSP